MPTLALLPPVRRLFVGGSAGNEQLTAILAVLLLVLLAIEGVTLLGIRTLMTVHAFVGVLLIPVVGLKLASTGWRTLNYYRRSEEYLRRGPPHVILRILVAPAIVLSSLGVFGTGVALLALGACTCSRTRSGSRGSCACASRGSACASPSPSARS